MLVILIIFANILWASVLECEPIDSRSETRKTAPQFNNTSKESETKSNADKDVSPIKDFQSCGLNEYYDECPKYCIQTCDEPERKVCVSHSGCEPRCVCRDGFVRLANWTCATLQQCPLNRCGENQHYSECGTKCPLTCDNYHNPPYCGDECFRGCFCNYGYVKGNSGKCIKRNECSVEQNCGENEYYDPNGSACPPNTDNLNPQCPNARPVAGCFCAKGYIRGAISKVCVPFKVNDIYSPEYSVTKVPPHVEQTTALSQRCPLNEIYLTCGRDCGRRCSDYDKNPVCINDCFDGCFCAADYVRDDSTEKCVRPQECSKHSRTTTTQSPARVCPPGMKYYTCSQCSAACTHYDRRYYRDKRSAYRMPSNRYWYWLSGKCLWPYQCDTFDSPVAAAYDAKRVG